MKNKLKALALVGAFAVAGTVSAYASSNSGKSAEASTAAQTAAVEQQKEQEESDQELTTANTKTAITEEQAKQIAMDSVANGVFKASELEDEDGVIVFGVEIQSGSDIYDVKVDANTGAIIKTNQDDGEEEKDHSGKDSEAEDNDNNQQENDNEGLSGNANES